MEKMRARFRDERGAALVIVLIVLMGLTVLGAAGLTMTTNDIRHSENVEANTEAFYAADAGLQRYLGENGDGSASATYAIGASSVTVTPTAMPSPSGGEDMYRVRSVATHTDAGGTTTSRAVSALAIYKEGKGLTVKAALASGSGLHKNGGSGTISGVDQSSLTNPKCPASPGADVAGVTVPPGGYTQDGGTSVPQGDPDIDDGTSAEDMLEATEIDWESLSDGGGGTATYTVPPDAWPDYDALPADAWPVVFVDGNTTVTPDHSGRGTIIVTGNLTMSGSFNWDGVMLVGGYLTSNGYQQVEGSVVTGLNILLGEAVPKSDLGNGNKSFKYNSCYIKAASKGFMLDGGLAVVPGSWREEI